MLLDHGLLFQKGKGASIFPSCLYRQEVTMLSSVLKSKSAVVEKA